MVDGEVLKTGLIGQVKWFSNSKGYGFLVSEETEEDIFVHYSSITEDGYKTLKENQQVEFTLIRVANGKLQAAEVKKV